MRSCYELMSCLHIIDGERHFQGKGNVMILVGMITVVDMVRENSDHPMRCGYEWVEPCYL